MEIFDYTAALKYIHGTEKFGSMPGLERIKKLLEILGDPQDSLEFVHIAGTNGKGSTTSFIASVLKECGYKCGKYISPYVVDFRERIQINGEFIAKDELAKCVLKVKEAIESENGLIITEFELITAAAFLYFKEQKCDIVCLEVGLGGRFDATNVIKTPLISVITSISKDHTHILGDSISEIAMEKCGIIKENGVTVSYPQNESEAEKVIRETAAREGNRYFSADKKDMRILRSDLDGSAFLYKGEEYKISLIGEHQVYNCITALEALSVLLEKGFSIPSEKIKEGLSKTRFPARAELIGKEPLVILDGAHNYDGISVLKKALELVRTDKVLVMGMLRDKNYKDSLKMIAPLAKRIYTLTPQNPRALEAEELKKSAEEYCDSVFSFENKEEALLEATEFAKKENCALIVCGSLYLASELRPKLMELKNKF